MSSPAYVKFDRGYDSAVVVSVHLHRNLNQKQYTFALRIAPAKTFKLLDNIAPSHANKGQFVLAKLGQYWMQINKTVPCPMWEQPV